MFRSTNSTSGCDHKTDVYEDQGAKADVTAEAETVPGNADNELRETEADDDELEIISLRWISVRLNSRIQ